MRKFNFDNLSLLSNEITLSDRARIEAFQAPSIEFPFFAPQPGPLFATINGTSGDDVLIGTAGNDSLRGFEGDDILIGGAGSDQLNGGVGFDIADYSSAPSLIGVNLLTGGTIGDANGDSFFGIEGVIGSNFNDTLEGNNSANVIMGGLGDDTIDGGAGNDTAVYAAENITDYVFTETAAGVYAVQGPGGLGEGTDTLTSIETIRLGGIDGVDYDISYFTSSTGVNLTEGDDVYNANAGEVVFAGGGNDYLRHYSSESSVALFGQAGDDDIRTTGSNRLLDGGAGNDIITLSGGENIRAYGGEGNDIITFYPNSYGSDAILDGGSGIDTLIFHTAGITPWDYQGDANVHGGTLNLMTGETGGAYQGAAISNFERLDFFGGGQTDYITGGDFDDIIHDGGPTYIFIYWNQYDNYYEDGIDWNDTLIGGGGNDQLISTGGGDILFGGAGDDILSSQYSPYSDIETAVYESENAADYLIALQMERGGQNDRYDVYTVEAVGGTGEGIDTLTGITTLRLGGMDGVNYNIANLLTGAVNLTSEGDDYTGTTLNDIVNGFNGNDILRGLDGDDILNGGFGDDIFEGGSGADRMDGGNGADTVSYINAASGVILNLYTNETSGAAAGDIFYSIEHVTGTDFNDEITGNYSHNIIRGMGGDDVLSAGARRGLLEGGAGDDTLTGDYSTIAVFSSASVSDYSVTETASGDYTVQAIGGTNEGLDTILGSIRSIRLGGMDGVDYALDYLANLARTDLTNGDDDYTGTSADELINGLDGNDVIRGNDGDDVLYGDGGDDVLWGDGGIDSFYGGAGDDMIVADRTDLAFYGGSGVDAVHVKLPETINDFTTYEIDFRDVTLESIESLDYFWTGSAASVYADLKINASQMNQITEFQNWFVTTEVYFDAVITLDLSNLTYRANILETEFIVFGTDFDDTVIAGDSQVYFQGEEGNDTFIVKASHYDNISFSIRENSWDAGIDTLDMSFIPTIVNDPNGDYGLFTFDLLADLVYLTNTPSTDKEFLAQNIEAAIGWDGDDVFIGNSADNEFVGNGGADTAVYSSADAADYTITEISAGVYTVEAIGGTYEGTDTLTGVETIRLGGQNGTDYDISTLAVSGDTNLTNGDDIYSGTSADEVINGLDGNDIIDGGAGNNTLNGDAGNDTLISLGNDSLNGGTGNDTVEMGENVFNADTMTDGGADIDTISFSTLAQLPSGNLFFVLDLQGQAYSVRDGGTVLYVDQFTSFENATGSEHRDLLQGDSAANTLLGLGGNDTLQGRGGDDILNGGSGDNTLQGGDGQDQIYSLGNDIIDAGAGNDFVEIGESVMDSSTAIAGGSGIDTLSLTRYIGNIAAINFIVVDLQSQAFSIRENGAIIHVEQISGFENATGTDYTDLLQGDGASNGLSGLGGDDTLQGRGGDDILLGGDGNDILDGGDGNDILNGGAGTDIASYDTSTSAIVFDGLGLVTASGDIADDTLLSIEAIRGTDFNDRFFGTNDVSIFYGGAGADRLFGRNGDDELYGEGGDDIILGGRDNDLIDGGAGNDQLRGNEGDDTLLGGDGNDVLAGGAGADAMDGGAGVDRVEYTYGTNAGVTASLGDSSINTGDAAGDTYANIENLYGTTFVDTLYGDAGNNRIDGRGGDDMLFGGDGNDYLIGGAGDDVLNGESGNDLFLGQAGADIYQFDAAHGTDRIVVFTQGEDLIEFTEGVFDFSGLTITQDGAHVNIESSEGTIIANNSLAADFTADDFIFAPAPAQDPLDLPLDIMGQDMAVFAEIDVLI